MENPTAPSKPLYRSPIFYGLVLALLAIGLLIALVFPNQENLQSAQYQTGLDKPLVKIALLGKFFRFPDAQSVNTQPALIVNDNVFEALISLRGTKYQPSLAKSWTNPDKTTWRFVLDSSAKFQSGDAFTSADVKYSIDKAKADANWGSNSQTGLISEVKVVDDYTVDIKTSAPSPDLLSSLYKVYIVSKAQVEKDGITKAVGTGPYEIASLGEETAVLEASDTYRGIKPKVSVLVYKYYTTREETGASLENGDVDLITIGNKEQADALKAKGFQVIGVNSGDVSVIGFDLAGATTKHVSGTNGKNPFQDLKVRQAIWAALDSEKMISNIKAAAIPLTQLATADLVGYNPSLPKHTRDIANAKKLLSDAGYPDGFTFTMLTPDTGKTAAEEIKKQLAEAGIKMDIELVDFGTYVTKLGAAGDPSARDFSAYYFRNCCTTDSFDFMTGMVHTNLGLNGLLSQYTNKDLDKEIEEASAEFDPEKRAELTKALQKKVADLLLYTPVLSQQNLFITRDTISLNTASREPLTGRDISGRALVSGDN